MLEGILVLGGVVGTVLAASGVAAFSLAGSVLHICQPNEVLIFSGRRQPDGKGYYAVKGGRGWRVPLVERVDRLDLTNMIIDLEVRGAYSKGGIPLNVDGVANIKIAGEEPRLGAAVERLLGKTREEIAKIAKDVLEGNLRGCCRSSRRRRSTRTSGRSRRSSSRRPTRISTSSGSCSTR